MGGSRNPYIKKLYSEDAADYWGKLFILNEKGIVIYTATLKIHVYAFKILPFANYNMQLE